MRSRYARLAEYLEGQPADRLELSFADVERILGFPLPESSRRAQWWGNDFAHTQARNGWLCAGWMVEHVDLRGGRVTFSRRRAAAKPEALKYKSHAEFEGYARSMISKALGVALVPDRGGRFDYLAENLVCEVMFANEPRASNLTLAKITQKVWLLEKASAERRLLVFGGNREVPLEWLRRFGSLLDKSVEFYFVNGDVERLR